MIRGAFILAVGFGLGYAKALQENEEAADFFRAAKSSLEDIMEARTQNTQKPDVPAEPPIEAPQS